MIEIGPRIHSPPCDGCVYDKQNLAVSLNPYLKPQVYDMHIHFSLTNFGWYRTESRSSSPAPALSDRVVWVAVICEGTVGVGLTEGDAVPSARHHLRNQSRVSRTGKSLVRLLSAAFRATGQQCCHTFADAVPMSEMALMSRVGGAKAKKGSQTMSLSFFIVRLPVVLLTW